MEQERIQAYFADPARREELISLLSRLVSVKSVKGDPASGAPFGPGPRAALDEALAICRELGFYKVDHDDHYVGTVDLNDADTQLHILGHLDVVGEGSGWETDPYTCVERDGVLYGRGVADDKGPVVAAMLAMEAVQALGGVSKNVRLILGTDEESGSEDVLHYYSHNPFAPCTFTPDANFPLINIEKGHYRPVFGASWEASDALPRVSTLTGGFRANVVPPEAECTVLGLTAEQVRPLCDRAEKATGAAFTVAETNGGVTIHCAGKNAHAASPEGGINAIQAILEVLSRLPLAHCPTTRAIRAMHRLFPFGDLRGAWLGVAMSDEESGPLTLNLALITLTDTGFDAQFDSRFPLCANEENLKNACEASLGQHGFSVLENGGMTPPHHVPGDSRLVRTLLDCYGMYAGVADPKPIAIGGGTYVHDIPGGVAFGCEFPGFDPKMHAAGEQARVDDLLLSAQIFTQAIFALCGDEA